MVLDGFAERDDLAEEADGTGLQEDLPVHAAEGDRSRPALFDRADGAVKVLRHAKRVGEVVEGPEGEDADHVPGFRQPPDHEPDGAVTAGHHDPGPRGDQLLEVVLRIEFDDEMVGERLSQPRLDPWSHRTRAGAQDQEPGRER